MIRFPVSVNYRHIAAIIIGLCGSQTANANGILRNGNSAESMALGGTNTASVHGAIDAMTGNPAGLSLLPASSLQLGIGTAILDAEFSNAANNNVAADNSINAFPDIAYSQRWRQLTFGAGLNPIALSESDWNYVDAPGGSTGNVSYGRTRHRSRFIALRGSLGLAVDVTDRLQAGAALGVIYNENRLQAPYIFQSQPVLAGYKTLLDLDTEGFGVNATLGLMIAPRSDLRIGLRYTTPTTLHTDGSAHGNARAEFGASVPLRYDADLDIRLPAVASAGFEWQARPDLQFRGQVDWIGWENAFDKLPVRLTNGSNATVNSIVGSTRLDDDVPLDWQDRFVFRTGLQYAWSQKTDLRLGYSYGNSPVPAAVLTPLNGAIMEHTIGFGLGHRVGDYQIDVGYQWNLPAHQRVSKSALRAGEYSNSELDVSVHWLTLNVAFANPFSGR